MEGVDALRGPVPGNLANFSLPFRSAIVIDSGNSFSKAAVVALSASVAEKAFSPTLMVIVCP